MQNYIKVSGSKPSSKKASDESAPGKIVEQITVHFEDKDPEDVKRAIEEAQRVEAGMRAKGLLVRVSVWKPAISVRVPPIGEISLADSN